MSRTEKKKSPVRRVRQTDPTALTIKLLFVRAGGRCQFRGCNDYLLEHPLTQREGNFAQVAHVVAFQPDGPRGADNRPVDINNAANLMLLCPKCHKQVDDHPDEYPRSLLESFKQEHEERIFQVTGLGPDLATTVVQLKARIGDHVVDIPAKTVAEAVLPRYPTDRRGYVIDLTEFNERDPGYYEQACAKIEREVERIYAPGLDVEKTQHISVFALAPIPLLVLLGSKLSNKVPVDLFQRHRDSETWTWKAERPRVKYEFRCRQAGASPDKVALVLPLSGTIDPEQLPGAITKDFFVYELALISATPNPMFLRTRGDLEAFRVAYQMALREVEANHDGLDELHFFAAVPAPVAVLCGRERFPKTDPRFLVYDNDKAKGGFALRLTIV